MPLPRSSCWLQAERLAGIAKRRKKLNKKTKNSELTKRVLYSCMIMVVVRALTQIPMPGVNTAFLKEQFAGNDALGFLSMMTGGSFERFSVMALSITPYITSSIIMQLMVIVFPRLEELQKEGETGRKKFQKITQYLTVALSLMEAGAMTYGYGRKMLVEVSALNVAVVISALTAGSMILVWLGGQATEKGLGNGISLILMVNIVSSLPRQAVSLWKLMTYETSVGQKALYSLITASVIVVMTVFAVYLQEGERRIPVQHSQKMHGSRLEGSRAYDLPVKLNTASVIPVIFASSIMSMPSLVMALVGKVPQGKAERVLACLTQSRWFDPADPLPTAGFILYAVLVIFFAYYYTSITFNPAEIAMNLKKSGGMIPGIRPGIPTKKYLESVIRYTVLFGAAGLLILCAVPLVINGVAKSGLTFGGTSLIIIVSVISEISAQVKGMMARDKVKRFV